MKFHSSVLFVVNIEKSKDFYIHVLYQEIEHDFGKNVIFKGGLTIWETQSEHIIKKKLKVESDSNRFELYFETEQLDEVYEKLTIGGTEFLHQIQEEPWGQRTIRFFDPDNHLVEVGESMDTFVMNMKNNGFSIEQMVKKSGIPFETVNGILSK